MSSTNNPAEVIQVVTRVRKMHHCGYCSGDECVPQAELIVETIPVPEGLEIELGEILSDCQLDLLNLESFETKFEEHMGSNYCNTCGSPWPDIEDRHDGVIDIVSAMGASEFKMR